MLNCIGFINNLPYRDMELFYASNLFVSAIETLANHLEYQIDIIGGESEDISPFHGGTDIYVDCPIFQVFPYPREGWESDKDSKWGFKWRDVEVYWYKRIGVETMVNRQVSNDEIEEMLEECVLAVEEHCATNPKWYVGTQWEKK